MRYKCPGTYISSAFHNSSSGSWNYLWNVTEPIQAAQGLGVPHTVEVNAIFGCANVNGGCPASYVPGGSNAAIVPVVQGYWTSFIRYVVIMLRPTAGRLRCGGGVMNEQSADFSPSTTAP